MSARAGCEGPITHGTARELARGLAARTGADVLSALRAVIEPELLLT